MSFTSTIKNELDITKYKRIENITLLSSLVKTLGHIHENKIIISTENVGVAKKVFMLFKEVYNITLRITVRNGYNFKKNHIYILELKENIQNILTDLSLTKNNKLLLVPDEYIVADKSLIKAYLSGLFLAIGSVNDPKKSRYHMEFLVETREYANFISNLLNIYDLNSKVLKRENKYMVYVKEAEKISDFLKVINANNAVLYYENIRIYRENKNMANRLNNCEQANVDKLIQTASMLVNDINLLEEVGALDLLDEKVLIVAKYRRMYPEVSLLELSEIISMETGNPITKSGVNHRLNKIKVLANKIRIKNEQ